MSDERNDVTEHKDKNVFSSNVRDTYNQTRDVREDADEDAQREDEEVQRDDEETSQGTQEDIEEGEIEVEGRQYRRRDFKPKSGRENTQGLAVQSEPPEEAETDAVELAEVEENVDSQALSSSIDAESAAYPEIPASDDAEEEDRETAAADSQTEVDQKTCSAAEEPACSATIATAVLGTCEISQEVCETSSEILSPAICETQAEEGEDQQDRREDEKAGALEVPAGVEISEEMTMEDCDMTKSGVASEVASVEGAQHAVQDSEMLTSDAAMTSGDGHIADNDEGDSRRDEDEKEEGKEDGKSHKIDGSEDGTVMDVTSSSDPETRARPHRRRKSVDGKGKTKGTKRKVQSFFHIERESGCGDVTQPHRGTETSERTETDGDVDTRDDPRTRKHAGTRGEGDMKDESELETQGCEDAFGADDAFADADAIDLERELNVLRKNLESMKKRQKMTATTSGFQRAFQTSSSPFQKEPCSDGCIRKYLQWNADGYITLALSRELADKFMLETDNDMEEESAKAEDTVLTMTEAFKRRRLWMNMLTESMVEIVRVCDGPPNPIVRQNTSSYHIGALGGAGYALARSGVFVDPSSTQKWLSSCVEFSPWICTANEDTWNRQLSHGESVSLVAVNKHSVTVITEAPHSNCYIWSTRGISLYNVSCNAGIPITLAANKSVIAILQQTYATPEPLHPVNDEISESQLMGEKKYRKEHFDFDIRFDRPHVDVIKTYNMKVLLLETFPDSEDASTVHLASSTQFTLSGLGEKVTWLGLTTQGIPVITSARGRVITLGLTLTPPFYVPKETGHLTLTPQVRRCLPVPVDSVALDPQALIERVWLGKEGSHYILEWVTVVPCLYDLISRETDKEKSYFYPVKVANDRIHLYICTKNSLCPVIPCANERVRMPRPIEIPYRLPTSFSDKEHKVGAKVITLCDWRECTTMNPTLQEEAAEEMYPWQTWDEIKYRKTVVELGHALASGSWGLHSQTARDRELLLSSITETRKNIELAVARAALRMIEERYYNGTLEMCKYFAYPGALEFVTSRFHQKGLQWKYEHEIEKVAAQMDACKRARGLIDSFGYHPHAAVHAFSAGAQPNQENRVNGCNIPAQAAAEDASSSCRKEMETFEHKEAEPRTKPVGITTRQLETSALLAKCVFERKDVPHTKKRRVIPVVESTLPSR